MSEMEVQNKNGLVFHLNEVVVERRLYVVKDRQLKGGIEIPLLGESFRPFFSPTQERACPSRHERQCRKFYTVLFFRIG